MKKHHSYKKACILKYSQGRPQIKKTPHID